MEETRTPLASAVGVAASIYTHQIANVLRVLTDIRVRHLLADEVGLGKTVQALMILNALRRQRKNIRALVIVPDRLVPQWRDELMTRAHTAPFETSKPEQGQYVRLAWEDQLRQKSAAVGPKLTLADIDPSQYQILIVDELHRLRTDLQDRIVRVSSEFEHVLILTATPSFQQAERHAQLFAILEPERTECARWEVAATDGGLAIGDELSKWPKWATQRIVEVFISRDKKAAAEGNENSLTAIAMAMCAYRRVIRTRRIDYRGVLPRRQHRSIIVEPLEAEGDRQALMWRYFAHLDKLSIRLDPVLLAKRVILSPPSLEQRVDFLRRKGHEQDGLLEQVKPLVHRSKGDSRADALVDLLATIWSQNPKERVLVAAQDNLTVDYLFELVRARLPEIGPIGQRIPLEAARVRQGMETDAVDDLAGFGNETSENLEAFQRGDAQLLLAPEAAQVGLNLQCARILVLYSVPWKPEEVEQWIGRLDRIGNVAAFSGDGTAQTIDVYTIAQRGLVDEKVVGVLTRFHAFDRSVNLDGEHLGEVAQAIEDSALRLESVDWHALEERTASAADEDAVQELKSALRGHLPWQVTWASNQRDRLNSMRPIEPVIGVLPEHSSFGPKAWDRAMEFTLKLLKKAGDYHLRWNTDPETKEQYQSLWYRFGEPEVYGYRPVMAKIIFNFGVDPSHERSPKHAHAFITRRGDIGAPPRRDVLMDHEHGRARRPLHFLNFGDNLHDEIIDGWSHSPSSLQALEVKYFEDHNLWKHTEPGWFILRLSVLDPAEVLTVISTIEQTEHAVAKVIEEYESEQLVGIMAPFSKAVKCSLEADVRWLRATLGATSELTGRWTSNCEWKAVSVETIAALMNPMAHGRNGMPRGIPVDFDENIRLELERLRAGGKNGGEVWDANLTKFGTQLRDRLHVVAEEARDAIDLAKRQLAYAEAVVIDAEERGNRAQVTRAVNLRDTAIDILAMNEIYWNKRKEWLSASESAVVKLRPRELFVAAICARRLTI